ncbi:unnamed protein product, partial [Staurois parvus]
CTVRSLWSSLCCPQSLVISCTVRSLWSSPVLCPQSLVIPVLSAVSGHPCAVRSLWSSPVLSAQSLVISCTVSRQSLVISCTVSAVSGQQLLYCVQSWSPCVHPVLSAVSGH